jgi:uncharacterized protein YndB with AHSA1/START domain
MQETSRVMKVPPEDVWSVLSDGWLFPVFVVGASRMREVDDTWPAAGSCLHHSVGSWPVLINDSTEVRESDPPRRLRLLARAWPSGEALVDFLLERQGDHTRVIVREDAVHGPGALIPRPLRHGLLAWRNRETLRRLAFVAERRQAR